MEALENLDPAAMALTAVYGGVVFSLWVLVLVVAFRRWKFVRQGLGRALPLAGVIALLQAPALVLQLFTLDRADILAQQPELPPEAASVAMVLGMVAAVGIFLVGALHYALQVPVTLAAGSERPPFPLLAGAGRRFAGWAPAALLGLAGGAASVALFEWLGVSGSDTAQKLLEQMSGGAEAASGPWAWAAAGSTFVAAALVEELLFRGVMLRWLLRWLGDGRSAVVNAVLLTAVVWAFGHALNAEPMAPKLAQVAVLGVGFGWLALRYSVEAAMVAHVVLNLTVLASVAAFGLG